MKRVLVFLLFFSLLPLMEAHAISEKLTVDMHYIVVDPSQDDLLTIKHMVNYTNLGEEEFKGDPENEGVLSISLPPGAMNVMVDDPSLQVQQNENGFLTYKPIAPKDTQVIPYRYQIPASVPIRIKLDYPIQVMQVLIPEGTGSLKIEGVKYSNAGLMQFEDKNFWLYNVEGSQEDMEFTILYDKNTQPSQEEVSAPDNEEQATESSNGTEANVTRTAPQFHNPGHIRLWYQSPLKKFNPHILLIVLGSIVAAAIGFYSYYRWKAKILQQKITGDMEEQQFQQLLARQNAIMDKIVELEDSFAQGSITEEEYAAKLKAYKEHLVKVKLNLRQFIA